MKREFNPWSDRLSKWGVGEMVVLEGVLKWAMKILICKPQIHAFTSRSAVVPFMQEHFWSEKPDALAEDIGFFHQNLMMDVVVFATPPIHLIPKVIEYVYRYGGNVLLAHQEWKTAVWYPKLLRMRQSTFRYPKSEKHPNLWMWIRNGKFFPLYVPGAHHISWLVHQK